MYRTDIKVGTVVNTYDVVPGTPHTKIVRVGVVAETNNGHIFPYLVRMFDTGELLSWLRTELEVLSDEGR